MTGENYS